MELAAADSEGIDPTGTYGSVDNGTVDGCIGQNDPIHLPKLRFRFWVAESPRFRRILKEFKCELALGEM